MIGRPGRASSAQLTGSAGNNTINAGAFTLGNDVLTGGLKYDVLLGGGGNDILIGGKGGNVLQGDDGRDFLLGGSGSDTLQGLAGGDILIAGTSSYFNQSTSTANLTGLAAVMAEWTRTDLGYLERIDHLTNGGGLNGSHLVKFGTTVAADSATDTLTGGLDDGDLERDWFFANLSEITDLGGAERLN